ncbi:large ribosomal subunit protein mL62 [Ambystoma mexicanum]|uniref:large ribosomal subunit protein mL62 n=1 Tax=Ambystoma mexicanum TaxID=8296 RepID=UPI0037E83ED6
MATLARLSLRLCRLCKGTARAPINALHSERPLAEYRSIYSLERLYPEQERARQQEQNASISAVNIPTDRLKISYCRSSGPGGQNVNKVNTKAEVRFHLATADWIAEEVRLKIAEQYKNRINKSGELIITSEVSRYQLRNLADCLQKLRDMITQSSPQPKATNKEAAEMRRMKVQAMNRERLQQKRINSTVKQSRRVDMD